MTDADETAQRLMGLALGWHKAQVTAKAAADYAARYSVEDYGAAGRATEAIVAERQARAALESALREAIQPAGWRLVPVEPTDAMLDASIEAAPLCVRKMFNYPDGRQSYTGQLSTFDTEGCADIYRAMIAAAPPTPAAPAVEVPTEDQP